jgi:hypothetical protein
MSRRCVLYTSQRPLSESMTKAFDSARVGRHHIAPNTPRLIYTPKKNPKPGFSAEPEKMTTQH